MSARWVKKRAYNNALDNVQSSSFSTIKIFDHKIVYIVCKQFLIVLNNIKNRGKALHSSRNHLPHYMLCLYLEKMCTAQR